ncbi:MAG: Txe/YoeB family addiction module toxin [Candidatus Planktophila sp.]
MAKAIKELKPYTTANAAEDLKYWKNSGNQKILQRIEVLIRSALETPGSGIGKPERLKFEGGETYSRRINKQHRLVYRVEGDRLILLAARFHYDDK